jgi:hypothetical protein
MNKNKNIFLAFSLALILIFSFVSVSAFNLDDLKSLFSFKGGKVQLAPPAVTCASTFPVCGGPCPPNQLCTNLGTSCVCLSSDNICGGSFPMCNGQCPVGQVCTFGASPTGPNCQCTTQSSSNPSPPTPSPPTCGSQPYPYCSAGPCPSGQTCQAQSGSCQCVVDASGGSSPSLPTSPPADDIYSRLPIQPNCENLPYGYDLLTFKIRDDYETQKLTFTQVYKDPKTVDAKVRYIEIESCNDQSFGVRDSSIYLPSGKKKDLFNSFRPKDGSKIRIVTDVKGDKIKFETSFKVTYDNDYLAVLYGFIGLDKNGRLIRGDESYRYWSYLYNSPYSGYERVIYDIFNEADEEAWNVDHRLTASPVPRFGLSNTISVSGAASPIGYLSWPDVPKNPVRFSEAVGAGTFNLDDLEVKALQPLIKLFDGYYQNQYFYFSLDYVHPGRQDLIRLRYDIVKNEFIKPFSDKESPLWILGYLDGEYDYNIYGNERLVPPYILPSGTNVLKATNKEVIILYSQKHQNRAGVTYGTVYGSSPSTSSSCVSACFQQASQIPSKCAPASDCKLGCAAVNAKEIKICSKKIANYYSCIDKAAETYEKKPSLAASEEAYAAKKCGLSEPCTLPAIIPNPACAARCDVDGPLCNSHETLSKKMTCEVKCVSNSNPQCSAVAFQVKLKAKKWTKVTIPARAPTVISVKEFSGCEGLQIRTIKGKKVGTSASYLSRDEVYAFKASKACAAKFVPFACRPTTPDVDAPTTDEPLEDPDSEDSE